MMKLEKTGNVVMMINDFRVSPYFQVLENGNPEYPWTEKFDPEDWGEWRDTKSFVDWAVDADIEPDEYPDEWMLFWLLKDYTI